MSCRWCTDMRVKRPVALDIFRTEFPPLNPVFPDMAAATRQALVCPQG